MLETKVLIKETELIDLINEVKEIRVAVCEFGGQELLFASDIKKLMGWSDTTFWRRCNDVVYPLPMTKLGVKLIITKKKFEKYLDGII